MFSQEGMGFKMGVSLDELLPRGGEMWGAEDQCSSDQEYRKEKRGITGELCVSLGRLWRGHGGAG